MFSEKTVSICYLYKKVQSSKSQSPVCEDVVPSVWGFSRRSRLQNQQVRDVDQSSAQEIEALIELLYPAGRCSVMGASLFGTLDLALV